MKHLQRTEPRILGTLVPNMHITMASASNCEFKIVVMQLYYTEQDLMWCLLVLMIQDDDTPRANQMEENVSEKLLKV